MSKSKKDGKPKKNKVNVNKRLKLIKHNILLLKQYENK